MKKKKWSANCQFNWSIEQIHYLPVGCCLLFERHFRIANPPTWTTLIASSPKGRYEAPRQGIPNFWFELYSNSDSVWLYIKHLDEHTLACQFAKPPGKGVRKTSMRCFRIQFLIIYQNLSSQEATPTGISHFRCTCTVAVYCMFRSGHTSNWIDFGAKNKH